MSKYIMPASLMILLEEARGSKEIHDLVPDGIKLVKKEVCAFCVDKPCNEKHCPYTKDEE